MDCAAALPLASGGQIIVCTAAPEFQWWTLLTPALVLLSVLIAYFALRNARAIARQKATLDLIEKMETDDHYRQLSDRFSLLRRSGGFGHLNEPSAGDAKDRRAVLDYLNHYEIVAIGIRENILDSRFYRKWMEGTFVRDWNAAAQFVQRERWKHNKQGWTYRASVYEHYQLMACKWSADAVRLSQASSRPPAAPQGAGDEALPRSSDEQDRGGTEASSE